MAEATTTRTEWYCATTYDLFISVVPVEAMALGTPVIASDSGGPRESVGNIGGFLVEHHAAGFWEGMNKALELSAEQRNNLGKDAIQRVQDKFSLQAFTENLDRIIQDPSTTSGSPRSGAKTRKESKKQV